MSLSPILRMLGVLVGAATFLLWASGGFHTGWTQNKIEVRVEDPITGLEAITYQDTFIAGVEILGLGLIAGGGLFILGIFLRKKAS